MNTTGVVEWFNKDRGFGFIEAKDGKKVFCHFSNIETGEIREKNLVAGQNVVFNIEKSERGTGYEARNVKIV